MFAEEHSSNTSRRRQEAARARRRELKKQQKKKEEQQQQQQQQQQKANDQQQQQHQTTTPPPTTTTTTLPSPSPPPSTTSNTAVDEALRQRHIRHENQRRITASITIQSTYRSHHSRQQTYQSQSTLFDKRMSDLSTLSRLIASSQSSNNSKQPYYIPPPATVSLLTDHLLFLSKKKEPKAPQRWEMLSQYALLPGVISKDADDSMDPLSLWLQSSIGKRRFRLVLTHLLQNITPPSSRLLRIVMGCHEGARTDVVTEGCRHLLHGGHLDLLTHLRSNLMQNPIPSTAASRREGCIPPDETSANNALFEIVKHVLETELSKKKNGEWVSRFLTEILTVPLILWKVPLLSTLCQRSAAAPQPLILSVITMFLKVNGGVINEGGIVELLPVVNLTTCPCPSVLSLLSNLSQLMRLCDVVNATQKQWFDYNATTTYLSLLSTLLLSTPIGTFSSRSAVEWIHDETKSTPIILSPVIIDHCRILLVESYVRSLFLLAIDDEVLKTEEILERKGESDERHERDLRESGGDAMSLAVREARVKRSAWVGSRWARKLSQSVSNLFTADTPSTPLSSSTSSLKGSTKLLNTSTLSRQLAHGHQIHTINKNPPALTNSIPTQSTPYSTNLLLALCRLYAIIIIRWGGNGYIESEPQAAMKSQEACVLSLLNVLTFSTGCVRTLWGMIQGDKAMSGDLNRILNKDGNGNTLHSLSITPTSPPAYPLLLIFISTLTHTLLITDDCEIHDMEKPLPKHQILRLILLLKKLLYTACRHKTPPTTISTPFSTTLISTSAKLMRDLYDRSSRRPLCLPKLWIIEHLLENDISKRQSHEELLALLSHPILTTAPFLVPFQRRLLLFSYIISTSRAEIQGSNVMNLKPGIPIAIGRHRVLEDGLRYLNTLGPNLRRRIVVSYLNEAGVRETGVDVGGMFKEFWTDLSRLAFDPNYALFRGSEVTVESGATASLLYPNPLSGAAHGADHVVLFQFLGRILGKAMYEGITIQPLFAHFFLSFMRGDYNFLHMMSDLSTLDQQLYNNLMFLKNYEGDVADLCLTFSVANDDFGTNREIPLIPNGANIDVTSANKQRYIALVAKHHVCDRLRTQSEAFTHGLNDVIPSSWLKIFNEPELQVLISGSTTSKIDVDDMRSNSRLTGGYTLLDRNVHRFWNIVKGMTEREQAMLLKFVTSCERPPPLGFQSMNPPFTIQRVGIVRDDDKLPSAATCFNTLKLPTYSSEKVMKQRLLFSIKAGAGFELT